MALTLEPAIVASRRDWAPGLFSLTLDRTVPFRAGQFLTLSTVPDGTRDTRRAYSVASAPGEPLEFFIIEVPGGHVSPMLSRVRAGDALYVSTVGRGLFTLDDLPAVPDLWMFATGTGVAPFRSMLRDGAVLSRFERVVLIYCARWHSHLAYLDELLELQVASGGRLAVLPLCTRDAPPESGLRGRATNLLAEGTLESHLGLTLSPDRSHVMLCGNPEMLTEVQALLAPRGLRRHLRREPGHITTEKYW